MNQIYLKLNNIDPCLIHPCQKLKLQTRDLKKVCFVRIKFCTQMIHAYGGEMFSDLETSPYLSHVVQNFQAVFDLKYLSHFKNVANLGFLYLLYCKFGIFKIKL